MVTTRISHSKSEGKLNVKGEQAEGGRVMAIDFTLTPEQKALQEQAREIALGANEFLY